MVVNQVLLSGKDDKNTFENISIIINTENKLSQRQFDMFVGFAQDFYETLLTASMEVNDEEAVINTEVKHHNLRY
jgi:hypothetical protein